MIKILRTNDNMTATGCHRNILRISVATNIYFYILSCHDQLVY